MHLCMVESPQFQESQMNMLTRVPSHKKVPGYVRLGSYHIIPMNMAGKVINHQDVNIFLSRLVK